MSMGARGRIEIKGYEDDWGGVCDDGAGVQQANAFCKQAGFKLGAKEADLLSRFGDINEKINLDDVDCNGKEESILECKFNENREWWCKAGECKNLNVLCDTVEDCDDGSDEEVTAV